MSSIFIVARLNDDGSIAEIISAHPTHQIAANAERFYRGQHQQRFGLLTDIFETSFEAQ